MKKYIIAIYLRLSKEDDRWKDESNSITMQRALLVKYVEENFTDYELREFCDDGYTGTNFDRPGMQEMLKRIKGGEINCVIVKDFSRFARDYVELGSYLEQIFPFLGVRFISVGDGYDSSSYQGSIADLDVNFKNLLYDLYSKDLSEKVRASLAIRKEKGQYVSASSPFGYEKAPEDRHALLVAEDEAEVVRRIFSLTLDGHTSVEIAKLFNETGVKTPIQFKIEKGKTSRKPKGGRFLWSSSIVCRILRDETYIGNIVQKKYTRDFVGGKNRLHPREEWLVSYGHHEPIINKEDFDRVQEGRGKKKLPQRDPTHPLVGKLVCGCCKKNLSYNRRINPYFTCYQRYSNTLENCVSKVNVMFMEQYILFKLQDKLEAEGEQERLCMEEAGRLGREISVIKDKKRMLSARLEDLNRQKFESYQKYVDGWTETFQSDTAAVKRAEEELMVFNEQLQELETAYNRIKSGESGNSGGRFAELTKEMIGRYIDKVLVYDEQHIEILWKENYG
ncbi:MAG: recombinase family protein [Lachnospiraceae bacterium]|nr:recombinase family protein [Lachnospiraceae bacterium]